MSDNLKDNYSKSILVIGGGIGGLYCAWKLLKNGFQVTLVERQNSLGGLATSIQYNDFKMDIGPHFVTVPKNSKLTEEIRDLMREDIVLIPNVHDAYRVYYKNSIVKKYPTLHEIIFKNGTKSVIKSFFSFLFSKIKYNFKNIKSSKEYLTANYGDYLYKTWFKPYLDFAYGDEELSLELIKTRFPPLKIREILQKINKKSNNINVKNTSSDVEYWYFKNGIGTLAERLSQEIYKMGGEIILESNIESIQHDKEPKEILIKNLKELNLKSDIILYTTPPKITQKWFKLDVSDNKVDNAANAIIVFLFINKSKVFNWWLMTNYDKKFPFFRLTHQNFLTETICPKGKSLICIEINAKYNTDLWESEDDLIFRKIINSLDEMNLFDTDIIEDYKILKFKNLYHGVNSTNSLVTERVHNMISKTHNEFVVGAQIDAGTLVTERLENNDKKSTISLGGIFLTLENADVVVDRIIDENRH